MIGKESRWAKEKAKVAWKKARRAIGKESRWAKDKAKAAWKKARERERKEQDQGSGEGGWTKANLLPNLGRSSKLLRRG